jgi:uncharacterized DUF497 family protein
MGAMAFIWNDDNMAHLAGHGVGVALAEKIFLNARIVPSETSANRFIAENTIEGKHYRLVFDILSNNAIYPVTAFPIRKRKYL